MWFPRVRKLNSKEEQKAWKAIIAMTTFIYHFLMFHISLKKKKGLECKNNFHEQKLHDDQKSCSKPIKFSIKYVFNFTNKERYVDQMLY